MFHVVLHPTDKLSVSHPMHVHSKTSAAFWDSIAQGGSSEDMRVHFQDMQRLSRSIVVPHMDVMEFRRSLDAKFSRTVATGEYLPCFLSALSFFSTSFSLSLSPFLFFWLHEWRGAQTKPPSLSCLWQRSAAQRAPRGSASATSSSSGPWNFSPTRAAFP